MKVNLPKTYSQNDPQWKNTTLGTSGTIGDYGCLLTDIAMVSTYFGHNETPITINDKLKQNGGFVNGNLYVWGGLTTIYSDIQYQGQVQTPDPLTKSQMDSIRSTIDRGFPVILQIDTIPATSQLDEHWILAIDYDGDDFIVQDPWDGATKRITSWGVAPQQLIYAYAYYSGTPAPAISNPPGNSETGVNVDPDTFQQLVTKASQWDTLSAYLHINNTDASGGQTAVSDVTQIRGELANTQQDRDAVQANYSRLQNTYGSLQMQYNTLQNQYNVLQQDYASLQQSGGSSSEAQRTIKELQTKILDLQNRLSGQPVPENASTKPFWESKKIIVTTLSTLASSALIVFQTANIHANDDWQTSAVKVLSAAAAALGISGVAGQYVKVQGAIDKSAVEAKNP